MIEKKREKKEGGKHGKKGEKSPALYTTRTPGPEIKDPNWQKDSHRSLSEMKVRCCRKFRLIEIYSHCRLSLCEEHACQTSGQCMRH